MDPYYVKCEEYIFFKIPGLKKRARNGPSSKYHESVLSVDRHTHFQESCLIYPKEHHTNTYICKNVYGFIICHR